MHAKGGISRLAPSPTGALHLGHACTFVANWLMARKSGWRLLLRLDDLDAPRVQSSGHDVLDTLRGIAALSSP
jgi:glutamyl-tRNA synthetase